jgi:3-oxoacyl-[acyl-carrier protein] reductase
MNKIDLKGRTAVVTGGAQGIGLAIVKRLIASGAKVAIWDRDEKTLRRTVAATRGKAIGQTVDVSDWDSVQAATAATAKALRRIDILVNNAGISGKNMPTADYPVEEWQRVLGINLTGAFHCCKAIVPLMTARKYGRIVNIASIAGKEGNPNAVAYSASKAGVISLTKSLGKELAQSGVLVNAVTPAAARTAIFDQMTQQHIDYMLSKIPMGRFVKVEEIAALVAWLASEDCGFSTGAVFDISGGRGTY